MNEDHNVLNLIILGDEAHFHVMAFATIRNMHYCAPVNLEKCKNNYCIQKVSICCIVGTSGIVVSFSFDNDNGESIIVTAEHCVAMLQNFLLPQLGAIGADPINL